MNSQETTQGQSLFIRNEQCGSAGRRRRTRSFLLAALWSLMVLLSGSSFAQSALTDDAHVALSQGNANHGANPHLHVSSAENAYIKFKLTTTLPADTPGSDVERATLKLYVDSVRTAGKLDVYAVSGAWGESSITSGSAPPLGALITTSAQVGADQKGKFIVVDITSLVQQWLGDDGHGANGLPNHGLALVAHPIDPATPEVVSITFDSKENSQTSHEAQLNIQLERAADGLQKVEHDASLTGDGTSASPLGVANGGINSVHLANDAVTNEKIADGAVTSTELADGTVTSAKVAAPLSLTSADANFTLSAANTGAGAAITATGAINTTTQYNIDGFRILSNDGTNNLFAGVNAGRSNTTGRSNSFFGDGAGLLNTTGLNNSFFGTSAGSRNTTGFNNSYFGAVAGGLNTTGIANSFFGRSAGRQNTTGGNNSFFGADAGQNNMTGDSNSFFGSGTGFPNTTGRSNSFFGLAAGSHNTTGNDNSFFGTSAGTFNESGNNNTFIGRFAAFSFGVLNTTGNDNTLLGANAIVESNISNATAIGSRAQVTQSHSLVLGGIAGVNGGADTNVGIGTTAPKAKLHVASGKIYVEANGQGVILKAPGGACFELTVTNAGALAIAPVSCP